MSPTARRRKTQVDPELRAQLDQAALAKGLPIEAVVRLRPSTRRASREPAPEATRELAQKLLERVAEELGAAEAEYAFNVFPNLGYLVLSASAGFVERVLRQPEVASASANRRRG